MPKGKGYPKGKAGVESAKKYNGSQAHGRAKAGGQGTKTQKNPKKAS